MEIQYAKSEFGEDCTEAKIIKTIYELDPLPNKTDDEKMSILSSKGTTDAKYILSCNLSGFVNRAIHENESFLDLKYVEKMEILSKYVQEIIDENKKAIVPIMPPKPDPIPEP